LDITSNGFYEDFIPGDIYRHARGKTIMEYDNVATTLQVMNTAAEHFNEHKMQSSSAIFPQRVTFGGVTIATLIGLTMQDTAENAIRELRMDKIRLKAPVFHGDTLYAYSKVLSKQDSDTYPLTSGIVHFEHYGVNQNNLIVFQAERWVLVKKRLT